MLCIQAGRLDDWAYDLLLNFTIRIPKVHLYYINDYETMYTLIKSLLPFKVLGQVARLEHEISWELDKKANPRQEDFAKVLHLAGSFVYQLGQKSHKDRNILLKRPTVKFLK